MADVENERADGAGPLCADLRSKKYYFLDGPPRTSADLLDASNDCWCGRTMERVGPDHGLVHPDDCGAARACFRSLAPTLRPLA